jgi:hypothetical protein
MHRQRIERIAVRGKRSGNEAPVGGISDTECKRTLGDKPAKPRLIGELDAGAARRLHYHAQDALFAGHDLGAENWATIASLVESCKLNAVDPLAWITDTLTKLVNLWPASRIDELMPWAYAARSA